MARRWFSCLRKVEALFLLGIIPFLCLVFVAVIQVNNKENSLHGFMITDNAILSSLTNFTLGHSDDNRRRDYLAANNGQPILYLVGDGNQWYQSGWNSLSKQWHSNSSYSDLLGSAEMIDALPSTKPQLKSGRIIFILHNHPKMASTTLRRACWENLRSTCNVVSTKRDPLGYANAKDLESLLNKCKDTHHFCVMGWHYNPRNFPNITPASSTQPIVFVHLFPFRNFDVWAASAMKQVFVGHSEAGCKAAAQRLEKCHGWLELDFDKYPKQAFAKMLEINKQQQTYTTHHFVLYDFEKVQSTLEQLSDIYNAPMMPYLDMQYKQTRRDGSCSDETLQKFHACFDERLVYL